MTDKMDQAEKLLELKTMLDRGLIDEKQFKQLRNQILNPSSNPFKQESQDSSELSNSNQPNSIFKNRNFLFGLACLLALVLGLIFIINSKDSSNKIGDNTISDTKIQSNNIVLADNQDFLPDKTYKEPNQISYPLMSNFYRNDLTEALYPIGWSKDGKFAFFTVHPNEASDCERTIFLIQDMVTDKILYQLNSRDYCNDEMEGFFSKAWSVMQNQISSKLNEYKIVENSSLTVQRFPLINNGSSYDMHVYNRAGGYDISDNLQISASTVHIKKNDVIGKKIFGVNYTQDPPINTGVAGYIKSPFENRLAVIYLSERRGYEGPPNVVNYELIGCEIGGGY